MKFSSSVYLQNGVPNHIKLIGWTQDIIQMFTKQISTIDPFYSYPTLSSVPFTLQANALEFQYQLCQIFLKKTGEQLHQKEAELMAESEDLIKNISRRESEKDMCISTDQGSEEVIISEQEDDTSSNINSLKRGDGVVWRKIQNKMAPCMAQIEQKCSALCAANVRGILNDYRQLIQRWWEVQAREGLMQRKNIHFQRQHEQNLILKQKMSTQNLKLETMQCEIDCLKQKNQTILDYANQRLQEMMGNQKLIEINGKVYRDIKNYLDDKQKNATNRLLRAQSLENDLLSHITHILPSNSCENCCIMLRKLKDSLIKFKKYLQNESGELENLYHKYRKTLFSQKSQKHF